LKEPLQGDFFKQATNFNHKWLL